MRSMRSANVGFLLAAALAVAACDKGGETGSATTATATAAPPATATATAAVTATATATAASSAAPESTAEADEAGRNLRRHHRHHHHGGVAMFIHMAIDTLGLPADKKAQVEKIQADLHAKMAPSRDAGREVLTVLSEGVAAGKIDDGKLDAAIKKQEAASAGVHAATIDALNKLHDALSPAERAALVDKVKAHVEVWKKVQEEEHGSKEKESHLDRLKEELSLTPDQVDKISAALKKDAPPKPDTAKLDAHIKAFETAFVADKFDAKSLNSTANDANAHVSKHGTARIVRFYKIVTPLLTPEQRTKLAAHLKERLNDPHAAK
jgi:Spy/CpxP family protein refolding chaperone